jgi:hypothetical protein
MDIKNPITSEVCLGTHPPVIVTVRFPVGLEGVARKAHEAVLKVLSDYGRDPRSHRLDLMGDVNVVVAPNGEFSIKVVRRGVCSSGDCGARGEGELSIDN